jgi:hypothetical protein
MIKLRFVVVLLISMLSWSTHANNETPNSPLAGNWISESAAGVFTQLEVQSSGRFVFRQIDAESLSRDYMCGNLTDRGDRLELKVGAMKERSASGQISEMVGQTTVVLDVVKRTGNQLVLSYKRDTVVLQLI